MTRLSALSFGRRLFAGKAGVDCSVCMPVHSASPTAPYPASQSPQLVVNQALRFLLNSGAPFSPSFFGTPKEDRRLSA